MPKKDDHVQIQRNIGDSILRFVADYPDPIAVGKLVDGLLGSVVKAAIPGKQTNEQVKDIQASARKAFARKLARKVSA